MLTHEEIRKLADKQVPDDGTWFGSCKDAFVKGYKCGRGESNRNVAEGDAVGIVSCRVGAECRTMYEGILMNAQVTAEYDDYYDVEIYGTGHKVTGIPKSIWRPNQHGN
jgi:hypothetical protein